MIIVRYKTTQGIVLSDDIAESHRICDIVCHNGVLGSRNEGAEGVVFIFPHTVRCNSEDQSVFVIVLKRRGPAVLCLGYEITIGIVDIEYVTDLRVLVHVVCCIVSNLTIDNRANTIAKGIIFVCQVLVWDVWIRGIEYSMDELTNHIVFVVPPAMQRVSLRPSAARVVRVLKVG